MLKVLKENMDKELKKIMKRKKERGRERERISRELGRRRKWRTTAATLKQRRHFAACRWGSRTEGKMWGAYIHSASSGAAARSRHRLSR